MSRMNTLLAYQGPLRHVDHSHRVAPTGFVQVEHAGTGKIHNLYAKGEEVLYTNERQGNLSTKATVLEVHDLDSDGLPDGYYVRLANGKAVETTEQHLAPFVHAATSAAPMPAPAAPVTPEKKRTYAIVVRHRHGRTVCVSKH